MFVRFLTALALGAAAVFGGTQAATAQVINFQESATPYPQFRGWSVYSMSDDCGLGFESRLAFAVEAEDTYYLEAGAFSDTGVGDYLVLTAPVPR